MSSKDFAIATPDPPRHLNGDAQEKWHETWPRLDHHRLDASSGRDTLAQYCEAWADIRQAEREIKKLAQISKMKTGTVVPAQGSIKTSRFYEQRVAAMERFDRAAGKLGLSLDAPQSSPWSYYMRLLEPLPQELAEQDEKETDPSAPGQPRIWTLRRVWAALQRSCGNMAAAARLLSETYGVTCAHATISLLVKKYPQLREAMEESEVTLLELCHDVTARHAIAGDPLSQEFLLRTLDPRFRNEHEVSGPAAGPIQMEQEELTPRPGDQLFANIDDGSLTREERVELASIAELVDRRGGMGKLTIAEFARFKELQEKGRRKIDAGSDEERDAA